MSTVDLKTTDFQPFPEVSAATLPAEDRCTLATLSAPSQLLAWADACEEKYSRQAMATQDGTYYIATVRSLRNSCTPVARLPNEVLMHVFGDPSLTNNTRIRRVCRRWRAVLLATAPFWANCISSRVFDTPSEKRFLCAALKHSGVLSVSIDLEDPKAALWNALSDHHSRISELWVVFSHFPIKITSLNHVLRSGRMKNLHTLALEDALQNSPHPPLRLFLNKANLPALRTLRMSGARISPSTMVPSLVHLELRNIHFTSGSMVINILSKCPLLEVLLLGQSRLSRNHDLDCSMGERVISLPRLREVTLLDRPCTVVGLLHLFKSVSFPTTTLFSLWPASPEFHSYLGSFPAIDFQWIILTSPLPARMCIELHGEPKRPTAVVRVFSGDSGERIRVTYRGSTWTSVQPFIPPISVLTVHIPEHFDGDRCECALADSSDSALDCLRRLELSCARKKSKRGLATRFLGRYGHVAGELELAWVVRLRPANATQPVKPLQRANTELKELVDLLGAHVGWAGRTRLGRLELYAVEGDSKWTPFTGRIETGSDARLCSKIVEPFLAELQKLSATVHIG